MGLENLRLKRRRNAGKGLGRALEQPGVGNQFRIAQLRRQIDAKKSEKISAILLDRVQLLAIGFLGPRSMMSV